MQILPWIWKQASQNQSGTTGKTNDTDKDLVDKLQDLAYQCKETKDSQNHQSKHSKLGNLNLENTEFKTIRANLKSLICNKEIRQIYCKDENPKDIYVWT